jgi:hypothetical protein
VKRSGESSSLRTIFPIYCCSSTPSVGSEIDESECSEPGDRNCRPAGTSAHAQFRTAITKGLQHTELNPSRPTLSERQNSHRLTLPGIENEGDRAERREEAEAKATSLRDEKLVEAAGGSGEVLLLHEENRTPSQELTVENVGRLEREEKFLTTRGGLKPISTGDSVCLLMKGRRVATKPRLEGVGRGQELGEGSRIVKGLSQVLKAHDACNCLRMIICWLGTWHIMTCGCMKELPFEMMLDLHHGF